MRVKKALKACLRGVDAGIQLLLPGELRKQLFPHGSLYSLVKKGYQRRNAEILQLSPLHQRSEKKPLYRVAYFNGCPDGGRSERYRVYDQVEYLTSQNVLADVYSYGTLSQLKDAPKYDLLILFRANNGQESAMRKLLADYRKARTPILYDVDDNLLERCTEEEREMVTATIMQCDGMTVTTSYLAQIYAEHLGKRGDIIPITISQKSFVLSEELRLKRATRNREEVRIAYLSGSNSHNEDFLVAASALVQVLSRHKEAKLLIVGPLEIPKEFASLGTQVERVGYMSYMDLLRFTADLDINLAPLTLDSFNQGKGETKITEAALVEVPTIASPIDSYRRLVHSGVDGYLATSTAEWVTALETLISDGSLRQELGRNAYRAFVPAYCLERVGTQLMQVHLDYIKERENS